jgi:hypothetical protein
MPTKEIPELSWIDPFSKAILIPCSKQWQFAVIASAPAKA